jgi:universal stress protein A
MTPFQKVLVPVDFSPHSAFAVEVAADLARRYDASVTLAYVHEPLAYALPEGYQLFTEPQLDRLFVEFEKQLTAQKEAAEAAGAPRVDTTLLHGFASTELTELAKQGPYDLIVMGTHGRTGLAHVVMGSVAERVVRTAPCPVLTVRHKG